MWRRPSKTGCGRSADVDGEELEHICRDTYRTAAPAKLVALLDPAGG